MELHKLVMIYRSPTLLPTTLEIERATVRLLATQILRLTAMF